MTTTIPKWTDERTAALTDFIADESPVSKAVVAEAAEKLGTSTRSISSKLRKLGYEVELASNAPKAFSDDEEAELEEFVTSNAGTYTYAEIAEQFRDGQFSAKAIQGKILSMELTDSVRPTPKAEAVRSYTDAEQATVLQMIQDGAFVEDIAAAVGKEVTSVRGKALSLLKAGSIDAMPKQRVVKGQAADAFAELGDVSGMTVAQIAEKLGKTERGVKTTLTRRGVSASDYDGAAKQKKASAAE